MSLATSLALPKSSVHGLCNTLTALGYLRRHDDVVDLRGGLLLPGLVDTHVHVNEPGRSEWEGFATATRAAAAGGVTTIIANGTETDVLARIVSGESVGTRFLPAATHLESRKRWLISDKPHGKIRVDAGAAQKLLKGGASLLPVGITAVEGTFDRGETLAVLSPDGQKIAHGLTSGRP